MSFEYNLYKKQPSHKLKNFFKRLFQLLFILIVVLVVCIFGIYCAELIERTSPTINILEVFI